MPNSLRFGFAIFKRMGGESLFFLGICLLFASGAFGQGAYVQVPPSTSTVNGVVKTIQTTITICAANTAGTPCAPALANAVFHDNLLTQPFTNPLTTDANGNAPTFALASGNYTLTVTAAGFTGVSTQISVACAGGTCTAGTLTVASLTVSGTLNANGTTTTSQLNGDFVTGSATYPLTGAGLQSAVTAAAGLGCVYAVRGTYTMSATLTIPSNSCIYWDNPTIASNGFSGDLVSSTNTSNVTFRGKLIINGSGMGTGAVGQGLNFLTTSNFSFDDIEVNGSNNTCMQILGGSHVRGNKLYLKNCGANLSTSGSFFGGNNGTTPLTDVIIHEVDISSPGVGASLGDNFFISCTIANPCQRINVDSLILRQCSDSCMEFDFSQFVNIGKVITDSPFNSGVLLRRGLSDINIGSISCSGSPYKICLDVANFATGDPSMQRITVGSVTATNANADLTNGTAVRVFNNLTTSTVSNVSIGSIVADNSTRGFWCSGTSTTPTSHVIVDNIITHNNKGDGVLLGGSGGPGCNDVIINSLISYDNNQGGTTDEGVGLKTFGASGVIVGTSRVFDDQGSKTQKYGFSVDSTSASITFGISDCQDALEVNQCLHDASNNATILYRHDTTARLNFGQQNTTNSLLNIGGSGVMTGLNDFGAFSQGKQFLGLNGNICTNGELALSAGWQSTGTATVTNVAGNGQTCSWTITTGTTTAANPTITDTLTNGISVTTRCWMFLEYGPASTHTAAAGEGFAQTTLSATAPVFTFNGTPTAAGKTYLVVRTCGP